MEHSTDQRIPLTIYLQALGTYVIDNLDFVAQIKTDLKRWGRYIMREIRLQLNSITIFDTVRCVL